MFAQTYTSNTQTPDSAATATALLTGVKSNHGMIGLRQSVAKGDCEASKFEENQLRSFVKLAQDQGTLV